MGKRRSDLDEKGSLGRGLLLLRQFRPGIASLGNGELAERTDMPRSTVSRLASTMVQHGLLEKDPVTNGYRLGPFVLSLARSYQNSSQIAQIAKPLMLTMADELHGDVNLGVLDFGDFLFLESIRFRNLAEQRLVQSGNRIPIELSSGGRAWLGSLPQERFDAMLSQFERRHPYHWSDLEPELRQARAMFREHGYCTSNWITGVVAIGAPVPTGDHDRYYVSIGIAIEEFSQDKLHTYYGPAALQLAKKIVAGLLGEDTAYKPRSNLSRQP